jgi:NADH-quinone oxidoreductase subunit M
MLLASLLLKLGGYGFLHFSLPFFYKEKSLYILCAFLLGILGVIFGSGAALHQFDLKRIIAYSSVAHMNLALLGLFSLNYLGISGSVILMVAHGLVSAALFFLIGVLYDRFFTRVIYYFAGLARAMPLFSVFFLFFTLANMGFPGTFNFLGELYILLGLKLVNELALLGGVFGTLLSATYSIWLYNKICFGQLRLETYDSIQNNQTEMP